MDQTESNARIRVMREEQVHWMKILDVFSKSVDDLNRQFVLHHERNREALRRYERELQLEFSEVYSEEVRKKQAEDAELSVVDRRLKDLRFATDMDSKRLRKENEKVIAQYKEELLQERIRSKIESERVEVARHARETEARIAKETVLSPLKVSSRVLQRSLSPVLSASPHVGDATTAKSALDRQFRDIKFVTNIQSQRVRQQEQRAKERELEARREMEQDAAVIERLQKQCSLKKANSMNVQRMLNPLRQPKLVPLNVVADRGRSIGESLTAQQCTRRLFVDDALDHYQQQLAEEERIRESELNRVRSRSPRVRSVDPRSPLSSVSGSPSPGLKKAKKTRNPALVSKAFRNSRAPTAMTLLLADVTSNPSSKIIDLSALERITMEDLYHLREAVVNVPHIDTINFAHHSFDMEQTSWIYETMLEATNVITVMVREGNFRPPDAGQQIVARAAANRRVVFSQLAVELVKKKQAVLSSVESREAEQLPNIRKRAHVAYELFSFRLIQEEAAFRLLYLAFAAEHRARLRIARDAERSALDTMLRRRARDDAVLREVLEEEGRRREAIISVSDRSHAQLRYQAMESKKLVIRNAKTLARVREKEREDAEADEKTDRLRLRKEELRERQTVLEEFQAEKVAVDAIDADRQRIVAEEKERIRRIEAAKAQVIEKQRMEELKQEKRREQLLKRHELEQENFMRQETAERERGVGALERKEMSALLDEYKTLKAKLHCFVQRGKRTRERNKINTSPMLVEWDGWLPSKLSANGSEVGMTLCAPHFQLRVKTALPPYMSSVGTSLDEDEITNPEWKRQRNIGLGASIIVSIQPPANADSGRSALEPGDSIEIDSREHLVLADLGSTEATEKPNVRAIYDVRNGVWHGNCWHEAEGWKLVIHLARNDTLGIAGIINLILKSVVFRRRSGTLTVGEVHGSIQVTLHTLHPSERNEYCPSQEPSLVPDTSPFSVRQEDGIHDSVVTPFEIPFKIACLPGILEVPRIAAPVPSPDGSDYQGTRHTITCRTGHGTHMLLPRGARAILPGKVYASSYAGAQLFIDLGPTIDPSDYITMHLQGTCIMTDHHVLIAGQNIAEITDPTASRRKVGARKVGDSSAMVLTLLPAAQQIHLDQLLSSLAFRNDSMDHAVAEPRTLRIGIRFPQLTLSSAVQVTVNVVKEIDTTTVRYVGPVAFHLNMMPKSPLLGGFVREAIIPCIIAPYCEVVDSAVQKFSGGYLSICLVDADEHRRHEYIRLVPDMPVENWAAAEESSKESGSPKKAISSSSPKKDAKSAKSVPVRKFLRIEPQRQEVVFGDEVIGTLQQRSQSWIFIEFAGNCSVDAVQEIMRSVVYQNIAPYSAGTKLSHSVVETVMVLGEVSPPFRTLRSVELAPPLVQVLQGNDIHRYKQGSTPLTIGVALAATAAGTWSGGVLFIELAAGFTSDDMLFFAEDGEVSLIDNSETGSVLSIKSSQTAKSGKSNSTVATNANSRKNSVALARQPSVSSLAGAASFNMGSLLKTKSSNSLLRRSSSVFGTLAQDQNFSVAVITVRGRKIGTAYTNSRSILVNFEGASSEAALTDDDRRTLPEDREELQISNEDVDVLLKHLTFENVSDNPRDLKKVVRITANDGLPHSTVLALEIDVIPSKPSLELQRLVQGPKIFRSLSDDDTNGFCLFSDVTVHGQDIYCLNGCSIALNLVTGGDPTGDQLGFLSLAAQRQHFPDQDSWFYVDRGDLRLITAEDYDAVAALQVSFWSDTSSTAATPTPRNDSITSPLGGSTSIIAKGRVVGEIAFDTPTPDGFSNIQIRFQPLPNNAKQHPVITSHESAEKTEGVISLSVAERILYRITYTYLNAKVKTGTRGYVLTVNGATGQELAKHRLNLSVKAPLLWSAEAAGELNLVISGKGAPPAVALMPKVNVSADDAERITEGVITIRTGSGDAVAEAGPELDLIDFLDPKKCDVRLENTKAGLPAAWVGADMVALVDGRGTSAMTLTFDWRSPVSGKQLASLLRAVTFSTKDTNSSDREVTIRVQSNIGVHQIRVKVRLLRGTALVKLALKVAGSTEVVRVAPPKALFPEATLEVPGKTSLDANTCAITASVRGGIDTDLLTLTGFSLESLNSDFGLAMVRTNVHQSLCVLRLENTRQCRVIDVEKVLRGIAAVFHNNPRDRHARKAVDVEVSVTGFPMAKSSVMLDVLPPLLDIPFALREGTVLLLTLRGAASDVKPVFPLGSVVVPNVHFVGAATLTVSLLPKATDSAEGGPTTPAAASAIGALTVVLGTSLGFSIKEGTNEVYIENRRVAVVKAEGLGRTLSISLPKDRARPNNALVQRLLRSIEVRCQPGPPQPSQEEVAAAVDASLLVAAVDDDRGIQFEYRINAQVGPRSETDGPQHSNVVGSKPSTPVE